MLGDLIAQKQSLILITIILPDVPSLNASKNNGNACAHIEYHIILASISVLPTKTPRHRVGKIFTYVPNDFFLITYLTPMLTHGQKQMVQRTKTGP